MKLFPAAFLLTLGLLIGCAPLPPPLPLPEITSASDLLSRLEARHQGLSAFQGRGRLTYLSPRQNYSGTSLIKACLPTTLRVDILDLFGGSLLSFYSDGQVVQVLFPKEGKFIEGPATSENLAAFIPPGMTLAQVVRGLTADLPLSSGSPTHWNLQKESQQYLLEWQTAAGLCQERLWVDARTFYPIKAEWFDSLGIRRFLLEWNDYDSLAPGRPRLFKVLTFEPQAELRLAFRELQLNPPLRAEDLQVPRPHKN